MSFFFPRQQSANTVAQEQEMDLFQLLSLLDAASQEESSPSSKPQPQPKTQQPQQQFYSHCAPRRFHHRQAASTPSSNPAFDILETSSAYELFGEVPGLDVASLEVRFEDAQTLVLRGKTIKGKLTAPVSVKVVKDEEKKQEVEIEEEKKEENGKGKQASVEDENDEEYDSLDTPLTASTVTPTASTPTANTTSAPETKKTEEEAAKPKQQQTVRAKYWLAERRTGQFARSFSFAQRIEIDDVTAELKDGVLHVVVPKSVRSQRVEVRVV